MKRKPGMERNVTTTATYIGTMRKAAMAAVVAFASLGATAPANAATHLVDVIASGTITSGSDANNLLGQGTNLAGLSYTLSVTYPAPGANYNVTPGTDATDIFNTGLPSSAFLTIGSGQQSTIFTLNYCDSLVQSPTDLLVNTSGTDAAGNLLTVSQFVFGGASIFGSPDLQTAATYTLTGGDSASDSYTWTNANDSRTVTFSGAPTSVQLQMPEPVSI